MVNNKYIYFLYFKDINAVKIGITNNLGNRIEALKKYWGEIDTSKSYFATHKRNHRFEQSFHLLFSRYNKNFKHGDGYTEFFDHIVMTHIKEMTYLDLILEPLTHYTGDVTIINETIKDFNTIELDTYTYIYNVFCEGEISINALRKIISTDYIKKYKFIEILNKVVGRLKNIKVVVETNNDNEFYSKEINYYDSIELTKQKLIVKKNIQSNSLFKNKRFNKKEYSIYKSLETKYSKELYRRLKQWDSTGSWKTRIEDFRKVLYIPEKYNFSLVNQRVIKPSLEELQPYFKNLKIEYYYKEREKGGTGGRPQVQSLEFKFDKKKSAPTKKEKSKDEDLSKAIQILSELGPEKIELISKLIS